MSLEVPWDVLGVPGVALGSAAGRSWSTMGILVGYWSHLGESGGVPWKHFGSACGTITQSQHRNIYIYIYNIVHNITYHSHPNRDDV